MSRYRRTPIRILKGKVYAWVKSKEHLQNLPTYALGNPRRRGAQVLTFPRNTHVITIMDAPTYDH